MADDREPPPLFDDDDMSRKEEESDIFASAVQSPMSDDNLYSKGSHLNHPLAEPVADYGPLGTVEQKTFDPIAQNISEARDGPANQHNLVEATQEISLRDDDDDDDDTLSSGFPGKLEPSGSIFETVGSATPEPEIFAASPSPMAAAGSIMSPIESTQSNVAEWNRPSEDDENYIHITVSDPQKIGDGMGSYMAYKVTTKTNIHFFGKKHWSVTRRFSDFLGLHNKLLEKHLHSGIIIPPAPEKAPIATTRIKLGSDKNSDSGSVDFLERRRAALERYMNRTAMHSTLRCDPDFREFLELDTELPKATQTSAISSAGVLRLFNKVGETVNKMAFKMEENDQWFEEKSQQVENLENQLRKLHFYMENLVGHRRELAASTGSFSKSAAFLSSVEEHSSLSRALHQLAEATDRIQVIHCAQADADFYLLTETTKDYISIIGAVKDVFHERVKIYQTWQHSVSQLNKKRQNKTKAELVGRIDKIDQANEEVREWESKVERSEEEFDRISRAIKKEMSHFDIVRVADFKDMLVKYLEALITSQQQVVKVWETFLPEAKSIA